MNLHEAIRQAKAEAYQHVSRLLLRYDPKLSALINDLALDIMANDAKSLLTTIKKMERHIEAKEGEDG